MLKLCEVEDLKRLKIRGAKEVADSMNHFESIAVCNLAIIACVIGLIQ